MSQVRPETHPNTSGDTVGEQTFSNAMEQCSHTSTSACGDALQDKKLPATPHRPKLVKATLDTKRGTALSKVSVGVYLPGMKLSEHRKYQASAERQLDLR
eukprot:3267461-Amphidinium_carterae.1